MAGLGMHNDQQLLKWRMAAQQKHPAGPTRTMKNRCSSDSISLQFPFLSSIIKRSRLLKIPDMTHDMMRAPRGTLTILDPFPNQPTDLHVFASGGPCVQTRWAWRSCLPQTSRLMVFDLDPKAMAFLEGTENINQGTHAAPTFLDRFSHHNSL